MCEMEGSARRASQYTHRCPCGPSSRPRALCVLHFIFGEAQTLEPRGVHSSSGLAGLAQEKKPKKDKKEKGAKRKGKADGAAAAGAKKPKKEKAEAKREGGGEELFKVRFWSGLNKLQPQSRPQGRDARLSPVWRRFCHCNHSSSKSGSTSSKELGAR